MRRTTLLLAGALLLAAAADARAQSLAARVAATRAEVVRFSFPAKPGVCGDGETIEVRTGAGARVVRNVSGRGSARFDERGRLRNCEPGPVVLELTCSSGRITGAHVSVGGPARSAAQADDLGAHTAAAAVEYLLAPATLAAAADDAGTDLVFAATLAAHESWPALLRVARDRELGSRTRSGAMLWLSDAAGDRVTEGLRSIIGDDSDELRIREQAVFALSRVQSESTVPQLMQIARTNREPALRRSALFWLGRSGDPRVVDFFEEILAKR